MTDTPQYPEPDPAAPWSPTVADRPSTQLATTLATANEATLRLAAALEQAWADYHQARALAIDAFTAATYEADRG